MNEVTRMEYVKDCHIGLMRWNMDIKRAGVELKFAMPSTRFRRSLGAWSGVYIDPKGTPITAAECEAKKDNWRPNDTDKSFVHRLMHRVTEPAKSAGWIAPSDRSLNTQATACEYVKL